MKALKLFIVLLSVAAIGMNAHGQEKYSLTYKFEKGKSYSYKTDMNLESVNEINGNEMKVTFNGYFTGVYTVESVAPNGDISCLYTLTDMKMHTVGMGADTTITLPAEARDTTRIFYAGNGKLISSDPLDTAASKKKTGMFSNLSNSKLFELPKTPVAIGETWTDSRTDTTDMGSGQMITITKTDYTLVGKEEVNGHQCLRFDYKGSSETTGKMTQMGMEMFLEGTGEPHGSAWFDTELGLVIKVQSVMSNEMTMAMTGQNQMTMPMTQNVTTTQTLVEK